ncbi:hypothetical protein GCM10028819_16340 [Spirosoma humi]
MVLFLTARDQNAQIRKFSCQLNKLEVAFEFLSDIVAKGSTLLQAYVMDEGDRTELPLAIFNGEPFIETMQELEKEWQTLLSEPALPASILATLLIPLIQQRARQIEAKIASYQKLIYRLEQLLSRAQKNFSPGPIKSRVISQYESLINQNQVWLVKAQVSHQLILSRLNQLSA